MAVIDPDVPVIAHLMDQRLADAEVIRAQQGQIIALLALLKAQERSVHVLVHLVSDLLTQGAG